MKIENKINKIETLCAQDVGRGIEPLYKFSKGNLLKAALSIANHPCPHIAIITGFYIPHGNPPAPETDGPIGTAHLANSLIKLGIPTRIISDSLCINSIKTAIQATHSYSKIIYDVFPVSHAENIKKLALQTCDQWAKSSPPISHVISIERVGPSYDGIPRNMNGDNIHKYTAPLHLLFNNINNKITIGIGDGGNELGMGVIPREVIKSSIKNGDKIACKITCDHLIVCGVSNWGGIALAAAILSLKKIIKEDIVSLLSPSNDYKILKETTYNGPAIDGVSGLQELSVDGLPWKYHENIIDKIISLI